MKKPAVGNDYGSLLDKKKLDLLLARARRKGLGGADLEDLEQDVVPVLLNFRFCPRKSNGATETTVLTALIDHQIAYWQRGRARARRHLEAYQRQHGVTESSTGGLVASPADSAPLVLDVQAAMERLTAQERIVCRGLMRGRSKAYLAGKLRMTLYEFNQVLSGIRTQFQSWGLQDWAVPR